MKKKKEDIERELEHYIKAMSDPKTHKDPELKKLTEEKIKRLSKQLRDGLDRG